MLRTFLQITSLIALGAGSRLVPHFPNMTAISAVALKSRAHFGPAGLLIPLVSMAVADAVIGFYDWRLLLSVYASFTLVGLLGAFVEDRAITSRIALVSVLGSTLFFFITNTFVWALSSWYPHDIAGLLACLMAGLPFYGYMLIGDCIATSMLFRLPRVTAGLLLRGNLHERRLRTAL